MRNVLAHDYLGTRADVVYDTVLADIPPLVEQLERLLPDLSA